ncbi:hypothetical protein PROFUN_01411 [Planoprotostelium fungivorum]|uniref:Uncharacterized protein n=1 Tax=Planoprotostelium fungivorum TaxID=1890364 RepID=A0A2P6NT49_9EUKA|nr:hypothetical protein PROFUN_01411 [Planoprotostelium fungivorum]
MTINTSDEYLMVRDLFSLLLTSKRLHNLALGFFYRHIDVPADSVLWTTLNNQPDKGQLITHLTIRCHISEDLMEQYEEEREAAEQLPEVPMEIDREGGRVEETEDEEGEREDRMVIPERPYEDLKKGLCHCTQIKSLILEGTRCLTPPIINILSHNSMLTELELIIDDLLWMERKSDVDALFADTLRIIRISNPADHADYMLNRPSSEGAQNILSRISEMKNLEEIVLNIALDTCDALGDLEKNRWPNLRKMSWTWLKLQDFDEFLIAHPLLEDLSIRRRYSKRQPSKFKAEESQRFAGSLADLRCIVEKNSQGNLRPLQAIQIHDVLNFQAWSANLDQSNMFHMKHLEEFHLSLCQWWFGEVQASLWMILDLLPPGQIRVLGIPSVLLPEEGEWTEACVNQRKKLFSGLEKVVYYGRKLSDSAKEMITNTWPSATSNHGGVLVSGVNGKSKGDLVKLLLVTYTWTETSFLVRQHNTTKQQQNSKMSDHAKEEKHKDEHKKEEKEHKKDKKDKKDLTEDEKKAKAEKKAKKEAGLTEEEKKAKAEKKAKKGKEGKDKEGKHKEEKHKEEKK